MILAAELLKKANELIKEKIHPTNIIQGFKIAGREACKFLDEYLSIPVADLKDDPLKQVARTSMNSKLIGPEWPLFAELAVKAVK